MLEQSTAQGTVIKMYLVLFVYKNIFIRIIDAVHMFISQKSCLRTVTRIKMESDEAGHSGQFSLFQVFKLCLFREPTSCIQTVSYSVENIHQARHFIMTHQG